MNSLTVHSQFEASPHIGRGLALFAPSRIVLTQGCHANDGYGRFIRGICEVYPQAEVQDRTDTPHNRLDLGQANSGALYEAGKQTLVFAVHRIAVRCSAEDGNSCPNYWHFSPYGFCPYRCHYCYLAGTPGVRFSPTVKIYVNLADILADHRSQRSPPGAAHRVLPGQAPRRPGAGPAHRLFTAIGAFLCEAPVRADDAANEKRRCAEPCGFGAPRPLDSLVDG